MRFAYTARNNKFVFFRTIHHHGYNFQAIRSAATLYFGCFFSAEIVLCVVKSFDLSAEENKAIVDIRLHPRCAIPPLRGR